MALFKVGSRAHHIHAGVEVVIQRDDGGETVHVGYRGGKSQRVPRGVLVPVNSSKAKENSPCTPGNTPKKKPHNPTNDDLRLFMREIQTPGELADIVKKYSLNIAGSAVGFGMAKMRTFSLLKGKVARGEVTMKDLWKGIGQ